MHINLRNLEQFADCLYYEPAGRTFSIKNTGDGPLQVLITLMRLVETGRAVGLHNIATAAGA
jgi:hypothetical protein